MVPCNVAFLPSPTTGSVVELLVVDRHRVTTTGCDSTICLLQELLGNVSLTHLSRDLEIRFVFDPFDQQSVSKIYLATMTTLLQTGLVSFVHKRANKQDWLTIN